MDNKLLRRLDLTSSVLLLLWLGMAVGFAALVAPALFTILPTRDLAGKVAGALVSRLDMAAWCAFGGALGLSFGARWLHEVKEPGPVGPLRLWTAAAILALLFTFSSTFIVTARMKEIRAQVGGPMELLAPEDPLAKTYARAHKFSTQFFVIRMVLAAALAWGVSKLPSIQEENSVSAMPIRETN